MTTEQAVQAARNPQEALLCIARALDRIEAAHSTPAPDPWADWAQRRTDVRPDRIPPGEEFVRIGDSGAPRSAWMRMEGGAEALAAHDAAHAVDPSLYAQVDDRSTIITGDEKHTDVVIFKPSEEKMERRRLFEAQSLRLNEFLGTGLWGDVYAKGGPAWLYYGNRDLFMSYPRDVRAAMVADIEEYAPEEAQEIARDALKFAGETGPGSGAMRVAEGDVG